MDTVKKGFKSRTVWTIVLMFVIGGVDGISGFIPAQLMPYIQGVLALLAMHFKINPSQDYDN